MLTIKSNSEEETKKIGKIIGEMANEGLVIALNGELGAGKTVFAQGVAEGLSVLETVSSPTYVIMNIYHGRLEFYHFDFYRLEGAEDLFDLGIEEYFYGEGLTLIEWAGKFASALPEKRLEINIIKDEQDLENSRIFYLQPCGWLDGFEPVMEELKKCFC